jgi:hypothetical protein
MISAWDTLVVYTKTTVKDEWFLAKRRRPIANKL